MRLTSSASSTSSTNSTSSVLLLPLHLLILLVLFNWKPPSGGTPPPPSSEAWRSSWGRLERVSDNLYLSCWVSLVGHVMFFLPCPCSDWWCVIMNSCVWKQSAMKCMPSLRLDERLFQAVPMHIWSIGPHHDNVYLSWWMSLDGHMMHLSSAVSMPPPVLSPLLSCFSWY